MKAGSEAGFSLVALVATMTITLILMGAAMPSWKYVVQNEREQELLHGKSVPNLSRTAC